MALSYDEMFQTMIEAIPDTIRLEGFSTGIDDGAERATIICVLLRLAALVAADGTDREDFTALAARSYDEATKLLNPTARRG